MPVPAVDKEKAALFNELVTLDPADLEQAGRIEWRLRAKLRSQPADRELQVCIVQALLQQGKAAEALVLSEHMWASRAVLDQSCLDTFQLQLMSLGLYEWALDLMPALSGPGLISNSQENVRRLRLSWLLGDFDTFKALVDGVPDHSVTLLIENGRQFCRWVDDLGLGPHLPEHQRIIRSVLENRQVQVDLKLLREFDEEGSQAELSQCIYVAGTYAERCEIEDRLYEGLSGLYASVGQGDAPFWDLMMPMVMDVTSRPPYALH